MVKRIFDIVFSLIGLIFSSPFLLVIFIITIIDTKSNGLFFQERIGQYSKPFWIIKFKTFKDSDKSISKLGNFLRKTKIDETPQLINVLLGQMSFVGPRPDIAGYYDKLIGNDRKILNLKPGITSDASVKYANEDEVLAQQLNPLQYNDTVIFPDKVKMNLDYYYNQSFFVDLKIIFKTVF